MKRILPLMLALLLLFSLAACGMTGGTQEENDTELTTQQTTSSDLTVTTPAAEQPQETPADPTAAVYGAYREIVQQREAQYGAGACTASAGGVYYMSGVAYVGLRDLDRDGVEELLLWENTLVNDFPAGATIEIWTYRNGAAVPLYTGPCRVGGDPSGQSLELCSIDGEQMLVLGEYGAFADLEFHAVRDGRLVLVHTLVETGDAVLYDGAQISFDEESAILGRTTYLCNAGEESDGANAILRDTGVTRAQLGL